MDPLRSQHMSQLSAFHQHKISEKTILAPVTTGRKKIIQGVLRQVEPELIKFGIQVVDVVVILLGECVEQQIDQTDIGILLVPRG